MGPPGPYGEGGAGRLSSFLVPEEETPHGHSWERKHGAHHMERWLGKEEAGGGHRLIDSLALSPLLNEPDKQ